MLPARQSLGVVVPTVEALQFVTIQFYISVVCHVIDRTFSLAGVAYEFKQSLPTT